MHILPKLYMEIQHSNMTSSLRRRLLPSKSVVLKREEVEVAHVEKHLRHI